MKKGFLSGIITKFSEDTISELKDEQSNFAGDENLIEIKNVEMFRSGNYGYKGVYTNEDIQAIADSYDKNYIHAPITLDHIMKGQAYGWIERVYAKDGSLFGDWLVTPETKELIASKKYKERSVEIIREHSMPNGKRVNYLRGCSLLGAATPHVKGMKPIEFSDDSNFENVVTISFSNELISEENKDNNLNANELANSNQEESFSMNIEELKKQIKEREEQIASLSVKLTEAEKQSSTFSEKLQQRELEANELRNHVNKLASTVESLSSQYSETLTESAYREFKETHANKLTPASFNAIEPLFKSFVKSDEKCSVFSEDGTSSVEKSVVEVLNEFIGTLPDNSAIFNSGVQVANKEHKPVSINSSASPEDAELNEEVKAFAKEHRLEYADALLKVLENKRSTLA